MTNDQLIDDFIAAKEQGQCLHPRGELKWIGNNHNDEVYRCGLCGQVMALGYSLEKYDRVVGTMDDGVGQQGGMEPDRRVPADEGPVPHTGALPRDERGEG